MEIYVKFSYVYNMQRSKKNQKARLLDDYFMKLVFNENIKATTLLLNVLFSRTDMEVSKVTASHEIKNQ